MHSGLIAVAWLLCAASAAGSLYLLCAGVATRRFAAWCGVYREFIVERNRRQTL